MAFSNILLLIIGSNIHVTLFHFAFIKTSIIIIYYGLKVKSFFIEHVVEIGSIFLFNSCNL